MTVYTSGKVEELRQVIDQDGTEASPASDERLEAVRRQGSNSDSLTAFTHTTGSTNAEALADHSVPDGVAVLVSAPTANTDSVFVGNSGGQPVELTPGESITLGVTDTSIIHVRANTSGDEVGVLYEG